MILIGRSRFPLWILYGLCLVMLLACTSSSDPQIVYITATPMEARSTVVVPVSAAAVATISQDERFVPTANPPRFDTFIESPQQYVVQSGDTLLGIATAYGVSLETLLSTNNLADPNILSVGQIIQLPGPPIQESPNLKIIPDVRFVRGPGSNLFNVESFIQQQPGYVHLATDDVPTNIADGSERRELLNATQIIQRVSVEYSVDSRLLLALLEYRAGWLSNPNVASETHPIISPTDSPGIDRSGLYRQLAWAANTLNAGYYGWKNRGWITLELRSGERYRLAEGLNGATVALQYFFSQNTGTAEQWQYDVSLNGFYRTYFAYFGDPFENAIDPLVPEDLIQPPMYLPFSQGETWFFTGGAHGGWGTGSAWSAIDFAPPDEVDDRLCYISDYWVIAIASGVITRSENGMIVIDLDYDGDDTTGWAVIYLHIAEQDRIQIGAIVQAGDHIGHASCEGGFSTATHLHIARRYNGEWIPAYCHSCGFYDARPHFVLSGWAVIGIQNQEYQGYLESNGERRTAEQGRLTPVNRVSW